MAKRSKNLDKFAKWYRDKFMQELASSCQSQRGLGPQTAALWHEFTASAPDSPRIRLEYFHEAFKSYVLDGISYEQSITQLDAHRELLAKQLGELMAEYEFDEEIHPHEHTETWPIFTLCSRLHHAVRMLEEVIDAAKAAKTPEAKQLVTLMAVGLESVLQHSEEVQHAIGYGYLENPADKHSEVQSDRRKGKSKVTTELLDRVTELIENRGYSLNAAAIDVAGLIDVDDSTVRKAWQDRCPDKYAAYKARRSSKKN